ncbi:hypothetical protein [Halogranum rubrum]|uniref:DUF4352 domain-containing protein n=1 Tax=Halogranum salarium B-1 TaxID=1210908 RepID=J2ZY68_9EURY|nr:hypothetical protein [Halogranum salarium]EJN57968.1 hypothetical protein HSB1_33850 [Halogranum salarium B-1]
MNRRTFLTTAAVASTGLAGCTASGDDGGDSGDLKLGGQPTKTVSSKMTGGEEMAFGETYELPQVTLSLDEPRTKKRYTWSKDGETQQAEAGEGKQWVVVPVHTKNTTNRTVRLPLTQNFLGVVGDIVFHPGRNKSVSAKYIGGKVEGGEERRGDMMFLTPSDVSSESFSVLYEEARTSGEYKVWWKSPTQSGSSDNSSSTNDSNSSN